MGISEAYRKSRDAGQEQTTPPKKGHSLAEIRKDKKSSELFGDLLSKNGREDLAERFAEGKFDGDDIHLLEEQRLIFSEKVNQSEEIEKSLTKDTIIEIARAHPDFAKIINLLGSPEKAAKVICSQLRKIAIADEPRFIRFSEAIRAMESHKSGAYKTTNDRVEKMFEDGQFSHEEYLGAIANKDPREKAKALRELSHRSMSGFKKFVSAIAHRNSPAGKWANRGFEDLKGVETVLKISNAELDTYMKDIGEVLFSSINEKEDMRDAFSRELVDDKAEEEPTSGFEEAKKESGEIDEEGVYADWETMKTTSGYDSHPEDQETIKDMFIADQQKKHEGKSGKRKGIWHGIFATMFKKKINNMRSKLK